MKRILCLLISLLILPALALSETVVTSFYPIWLMALNLTRGLEDHVTVQNLAAPSVGCLHDYQLLTSDMKTLLNADVFLVNGAGMEAFLPDIVNAFLTCLSSKPRRELIFCRTAARCGLLLKVLRQRRNLSMRISGWIRPGL